VSNDDGVIHEGRRALPLPRREDPVLLQQPVEGLRVDLQVPGDGALVAPEALQRLHEQPPLGGRVGASGISPFPGSDMLK